MPPGSTPEDHRRVKEVFLQSLRRFKKRAGFTLEIHAFLHATTPNEAHWDFVGYHGGLPTTVYQTIRDLWCRSGGHRASCVGMSGEEHEAVNRYQTHATPIIRGKLTVRRDPVFVFRPRAEMGGLEITWHTAGFWRGGSLETVWQTLIREWFGDGDDDQGDDDDAPSSEVRPIIRGELTVSLGRSNAPPEPPPYIPGKDADLDRIHFVRRLPLTPGEAVGITTYASQWGVDADYMLGILRTAPNARCLDGWIDPETGCHVFNAWHRD